MGTNRYIGPQWTWADRLRKVRRGIADVSQVDMAALVGVKPATYSAWEGGRNEPPMRVAYDVARKIEQSFPGQVSAAWMLGLDSIDYESSYLLPRMDSNHQPCDWGLHAGQSGHGRHTINHPLIKDVSPENRAIPVTFLPTCCESDPWVSKYQSKQVYGKQRDTDVSNVLRHLQSWGGLTQ